MKEASEKILIFIPMYHCEKQISRVLAQFGSDILPLFTEIIIVDNGSRDQSLNVARTAIEKIPNAKIQLLMNNENYGLGGSHKVAFDYAIKHEFDYIIVLHGDDQGNIHDLVPYLQRGVHHDYDCFLGARFMRGSRLVGYSRFRILGNRVYNVLYSLIGGKRLYDLGSGLNIYKTSFLKLLEYHHFSDDLTFNYYAILATVAKKANFGFFPISWREEDQISNVKLLRQSIKGLKILSEFFFDTERFLKIDHSRPNLQKPYTAKEIAVSSVKQYDRETSL
jgi:glycosyltransferase involved in cell wall biosynthesis